MRKKLHIRKQLHIRFMSNFSSKTQFWINKTDEIQEFLKAFKEKFKNQNKSESAIDKEFSNDKESLNNRDGFIQISKVEEFQDKLYIDLDSLTDLVLFYNNWSF